jgi:hypothetical protein
MHAYVLLQCLLSRHASVAALGLVSLQVVAEKGPATVQLVMGENTAAVLAGSVGGAASQLP